ncbi:unnamed protein product [Rotaria sp. Silwood2]|nr:unnamed protein product [Rotaria sp. Silwood2]
MMRSEIHGSQSKILTVENLNPRVIAVKYAIRGPIAIRAAEIDQQLKKGDHNFLFDHLIRANAGDCHASGNQVPITYIRQFIAGCSYPPVMKTPDFPLDIKCKVERLLSVCGGGSLGSYTEAPGIFAIRQDVADYIHRRDGHPSNPEDIYLCDGVTNGIRTVLKLMMNNDMKKPSGVVSDNFEMTPVPQFPLYSATLSEYGAYEIEYYLDEDNNWALNTEELERALNKEKDNCIPRCIVVINPGNPTVSFHSASKGWYGECGSRGGYYELINVDKDVRMQLNKLISPVCSTSWGQAIMDAIVNPPEEGKPSYKLYEQERTDVLNQLREKASLVNDLFNSIDGVHCNTIMGSDTMI